MKIWSKRRSQIPPAKDDKTYSSHLYQLPAKDFHDEGEKPPEGGDHPGGEGTANRFSTSRVKLN